MLGIKSKYAGFIFKLLNKQNSDFNKPFNVSSVILKFILNVVYYYSY